MWKYIGVKECNDFLLSLNLFNCNNKEKYIRILYSISNDIKNNYRIYKIKKRNGKYRTIYEPNSLLKHIQKQILINILENKAISKYAKAYYKGINLKDNALPQGAWLFGHNRNRDMHIRAGDLLRKQFCGKRKTGRPHLVLPGMRALLAKCG